MPQKEGYGMDETKNKSYSDLFCAISVGLHVVGMGIGLFGLAFTPIFFISIPIGIFASLFTIASWVLLIIARVRYMKTTFSKILLIVYICLIVLGVLMIGGSIFGCALLYGPSCEYSLSDLMISL